MKKQLLAITGVMMIMLTAGCKTNENVNAPVDGNNASGQIEINDTADFEKELSAKIENAEEGQALIDKFMSGEIGDDSFLKMYGEYTVFYTTPYGTDNDGQDRLFVLTNPDGESFWPVFTSMESMDSFYQGANRIDYVVMDGEFREILDIVNQTNAQNPIMKSGVVVNPYTDGIMVYSKDLENVLGLYTE